MCVSSGVQKNGIEQWGKQEFFLEKQEVEPVALLAVTGIRKAEFIHCKQFGYTDHVVAWRVMLMVWVIGSWERWIFKKSVFDLSLSLLFLLCRS